MKYAARTSVFLAGLLIAAACARANGPGGGHGSGGHASGGHASGGHPAHFAAHSFSASSSRHPLARPFTHIFHHGPKHRPFMHPVGFFPRHRHFGSFGCTNDLLFPRQFNCFNTAFFFDPFFFGAYSILGPLPDQTSAYLSTDSLAAETMSSEDAAALPASNSEGQQRVTLLQLLDGSMYGLTSYHVVGHELHYTTSYGGQNSVPLDRIDFAQTLKLNAERHVPFVLEPTATLH
jgi:hypothetical protein